MNKINEEISEEEKDNSKDFRRNLGDSIESSFDYQAELDKLEKRRRLHEEKKARKQEKGFN